MYEPIKVICTIIGKWLGERKEQMNTFSRSLQAALAFLYEDECELWRSEEQVKPNGATICKFAKKYTNIPCRLSRLMRRRSILNDDLPQIAVEYDARLYCQSSQDILEGDHVKIAHAGTIGAYDVLDVFCYASHKECTLKKVVEA